VDERRRGTYSLDSQFDVWDSGIVDELGVDEEGELCDTVGDPRRRSRVVSVRVDGDRATSERRQHRLARRACVIETTRGDDHEFGPLPVHRLPGRRVRRSASSSEHVAAAGERDHLRDPVACGVGGFVPLGDEDRPPRCLAEAVANGLDLGLHLVDDRAASRRHAEQVGERENALFDLRERVRVEGDDVGVGGAELFDIVTGDGADRAKVLGQDQVRLDCLE
jgi:hypothetical protein